MRDYAFTRYQLDISNALLSVKQEAMNIPKNITRGGKSPLKFFLVTCWIHVACVSITCNQIVRYIVYG